MGVNGAPTCAGCGGPLPPAQGPGVAPKWCSEACRKAFYREQRDGCVDCGAPTSSSPANGRRREPRCDRCERERKSEAQRRRIAEVLELRRRGLMNFQIAERLGITTPAVATLISRANKLGIVVPPSPYRGGGDPLALLPLVRLPMLDDDRLAAAA